MQDFIETNLVQPLAGVPYAATLVGLLVLALVAWIANWLTRRVLLVVVGRLAKASPTQWDDAIMGRRVLARLANVEIGRASCRDRGCQDVENSVGAVSLNKKHTSINNIIV